MIMKKLHDIRTQYENKSLDPKDMNKCPIEEMILWYEKAEKLEKIDPNAASLSTFNVDKKRVRSRMVLIKEISKLGIIFYTNYESEKAKEIKQTPQVAMNIYWARCSRQIRIEGKIRKINAKESEKYFSIRSKESQLSAKLSKQSKAVKDWDEFKFEFAKKMKSSKNISRPKNWGGYRVVPDYFEFWQGGKHRLHDRICYEWCESNANWNIKRLYP